MIGHEVSERILACKLFAKSLHFVCNGMLYIQVLILILPMHTCTYTNSVFAIHQLALESLSTTYQSFPHLSTSITLFQFGSCVLLPLTISTCTGGDAIKSFPRTFKQIWIYIKLSAIVYGATACATMSLSYDGVTYVTKVVFKSAKLIPTMIVGILLDRQAGRVGKKYTAYEYASAVLLCIGAIGFCVSPTDFKGDDNAQENTEDVTEDVTLGSHWIGISLLATSVVCDALVPNIQQQLMKGTAVRKIRPQSLPSSKDSDVEDISSEMMKNLIDTDDSHAANQKQKETKSDGISSQALLVNTNSIGFTLLVLSTILGRSFLSIISYLVTHPPFLILHVSVGMGLGTAVLAYTELIRRSGPAVAVAVATLRKVVTILLSYIIFPKPMTGLHLISAGLVVLGLGLSYYGRKR